MDFASRYKKLNDAQRAAVDTIDGPLMVVAGPGTGKTELLSMRAANILRRTDTLPQNILCLTFTESGQTAMRERLASIIGPEAYKVAVHTFHSFGSEIINQYPEHFYRGASFRPASDVRQHEILETIFTNLPHDSPIAGMMNDTFTYQHDVATVISELKRSGLTSDELLNILSSNERVLDAVEASLGDVFSSKITKSTKEALIPIATIVAELTADPLPGNIAPLQDILALSLSHAYDEATETNSTKPITAWRNTWMEKDSRNTFIFKDRRRIAKLRAVAYVYYAYLNEMQKAELFDFDDMVLSVVHALEVIDELRYNLQEQYLYIMVDEFQDTNLAQNRLLLSLTNNPALEGAPNIMIVGDDDQAIYSFQGAELSNILQFKDRYETVSIVTLTENYRSTQSILDTSRDIISQGEQRLEHYYPELNKQLHAHWTDTGHIELHDFPEVHSEYRWVASSIRSQLDAGVSPEDITVIARRHHELISLLPYLLDQSITVNYERRENVLEMESVAQLLLVARCVYFVALGQHEEADALLPELLSHPAWDIPAADLWQLSINARTSRSKWLDEMASLERFTSIREWIIGCAKASHHSPIEPLLDQLFGYTSDADRSDTFRSPLFEYFFSKSSLDTDPEAYLTHLGGLRAIRDRMREHFETTNTPKLGDFLEFIDIRSTIGNPIVSSQASAEHAADRINLMTAHKSKGLEFSYVYIVGVVDSSWGERVRSKSRLISYPENLPLASAGDSYDERLRLMYVAATRAKTHLSLSYSHTSTSGSSLSIASFLSGATVAATSHAATDTSVSTPLQSARDAWYMPLAKVSTELTPLLASTLERYKLSATHLNAFLDVTRGGPQSFLIHNLLRFPQAMGPNAAYGSAIHKTLQNTHAHLIATGSQRPVEDIIGDFDANLAAMQLTPTDYEHFAKRGSDHLRAFFATHYDDFNDRQRTELNFAGQGVQLGQAKLTGSLDLVEIDPVARTMIITDYKTGKPAANWQGKTDYEKIKLHNYRQQLMFYVLLANHSRDYAKYTVTDTCLQFVESDSHGTTHSLHATFTVEELESFARLIQIVWSKITTLDLPDISEYDQSYKGVLAFEQDLLT